MAQRHITWILIFLSIAGCGKKKIEGFETFINSFESESQKNGRPTKITDLIVELEETSSGAGYARCTLTTFQTPRIRISHRVWEMASETKREIILYHELGHCILNREHTEELKENGEPISIMFPMNLSEQAYLSDKEAYLKELFQGSTARKALTIR